MSLTIKPISTTQLVLTHKPHGVDARLYLAMVGIAYANQFTCSAQAEWIGEALDMLEEVAGVEMFESVKAGVSEIFQLTNAGGSVQ